MSFDAEFANDSEFQKLVARRTDVDLTAAALELARDAYPRLEFGPVFGWIEDRATELAGVLAGARTDAGAIAEIGRCLAGRHGVTGRRESYEQADGSFLNRVIELKSGIPISLSVLYIAVAERAGWALHGVAAPAHFLTRYEGVDGPFFVDAFAGGEILSVSACLTRIQTATSMTAEQALEALEPVGPRAIILRMLNNLKSLYARQLNWSAAWTVQRRLSALLPSSYNERRDLALITLKNNRPGEALDLLAACRRNCPTDEEELLDQQMDEARRNLAQWN